MKYGTRLKKATPSEMNTTGINEQTDAKGRRIHAADGQQGYAETRNRQQQGDEADVLPHHTGSTHNQETSGLEQSVL